MMDRFLKNVRCLGPRLTAKFGRKPAKSPSHSYGKRDTGYYDYNDIDSGYGFESPREFISQSQMSSLSFS